MQQSRLGPFALEEPLDGLAERNVLRGVHIERKVSMAIKLVPRSVVNRPMGGSTFPADVKSLQQLVHPGIARCYGGAVDQGQPYLALELVQGESLRQRLDRRGRLPWEMAVEIIDSVCEALQHAHSKGLVHGRITPNRILLAENEAVKLVGFDCAWADRDEVLGLRSPMKIAHYVAPEVFRGKLSSSQPPCDLFSLGVILFECLSGEVPWPAETPAQLVEARRTAPAPRVSAKVLDCPIWLDVLISKLLAVKRSERLSSADETHRSLVDAKQKVAVGMGTAQHAWSGKQGALAVDSGRDELRRIHRQGKSRRDTSPFYERVWFLALSLTAVIGIGIWALLPPSEDDLFAKAKPLMESENVLDWKQAEQRYLNSLKERFPDTKYADQIKLFEDRFAMHRAEKRVMNNERLGRQPQSESERQYVEAWRYEQIGDRLTAWQKYEALVNLFFKSNDAVDLAFVNLARRQIRLIKSEQGPGEGQSAFVLKQLDRARDLAKAGNPLQARRLLDSLVSLYEDNRELQPLVEKARAQLRQLDGS